jgi:hypothetical protein
MKIAQDIESFLAFELPKSSSSGAMVYFLPEILEGPGFEVPSLKSVQDIALAAGKVRVKPQFKRMFWRLLKLDVNGALAIDEIFVYDTALNVWFRPDITWDDVGYNIALILHQGLYPAKEIAVTGYKYP